MAISPAGLRAVQLHRPAFAADGIGHVVNVS